jgi:hypothetical protein
MDKFTPKIQAGGAFVRPPDWWDNIMYYEGSNKVNEVEKIFESYDGFEANFCLPRGVDPLQICNSLFPPPEGKWLAVLHECQCADNSDRVHVLLGTIEGGE